MSNATTAVVSWKIMYMGERSPHSIAEDPDTPLVELLTLLENNLKDTTVANRIVQRQDLTDLLCHRVYELYPESGLVIGHMLFNRKCPMNIVFKEYYLHPHLRYRSASRVKMFHKLWKEIHVEQLLPYYPEVTEGMPMVWLQELAGTVFKEREWIS